MARTCGGEEGRTDGRVPRACGAVREKAASFLCYFGSGGGGAHFNAIAEEKHAEDGAWQLATKYIARPQRPEKKKNERGENETRGEKRDGKRGRRAEK